MRFGFIGFLVLALLVGGLGVVAFNAGVSSGAAEAAIAEGATVVYQPSGYSPFGAIVGFFFFLLLIGFVMKAFMWRRMSGGPGGWGGHYGRRGGWDHDDVPERFRPMLEGWHRRAHGDPPAEDGDNSAAHEGDAPASPVTQAPVAQAAAPPSPVAQPPVAQPQVAQAPLAQAPVAQAPVAQAPVAQPPVAQPPVPQAPVAQAPVQQPPVAQPPVAQPPVAQPPVSPEQVPPVPPANAPQAPPPGPSAWPPTGPTQ